MMRRVSAIVEHPANRALLAWLDVLPHPSLRLVRWADDDVAGAFDEGGRMLFDDFGARLPDDCKWVLGIHNLMVTPSGRAFAAQWGRCTFLVRCDFEAAEVTNNDAMRRAETLDGSVDARSLGPDWAVLNSFVEEEGDVITAAYLRALRDDERAADGAM